MSYLCLILRINSVNILRENIHQTVKSMKKSSILLTTIMSMLLLAACGGNDNPTGTEPEPEPEPEPTTGTLDVSAATTGNTLDQDGYMVVLDGGESLELQTDGSVTFEQVEEGDHELELTGIQVNCEVGEPTQTVNVTAGETTSANFDVSCVSAFFDQVVFTSDRNDGEFDIYVMNTDGSDITELTGSLSGVSLWSDISHDGTRIIFENGTETLDSNSELYVMNVDGTNVEQITNNDFYDSQPAWSPDGDQIAFISNRDGEPSTGSNLFVMNSDGTGLIQLTDNSEEAGAPVWSPDGSRIAFGQGTDAIGEVYAVNPDGTVLTNLTNNPAADGDPAWSPDGSQIAFVSDRADEDPEIFIMEADGSDPTRVTDLSGLDRWPTWSPDGTRIIYVSMRLGNHNIHAVDLNGMNDENLTQDTGTDFLPSRTPSLE